MASHRLKLTLLAAVVAVGGTAYFLHSVRAVQGQGVLAQAPLNSHLQIAPAFIMAVDDSGSMTFETLLPPQDGTAYWGTGTAGTNGYFNSNGTFRTSGTGNNHHLIPHSGSRYRIATTRYAIPPIDNFGFARSHEFNPQYFNPETTYLPWVNEDGTPYVSASTDAVGNMSVTAARVDPRDTSPTINLTVQREEAGSAQVRFRVLDQARLPAGTRYNAPANCGGLGTTQATRGNWRELDAQHTMSNNCLLAISYFPAKFYLKADTPVPDGFDADARIGPINHAGGPDVSMYRYEIRPENYTSPAAYNAAIQNFANWFSYYGNRNRAMIASMTHSLASVNNMRVGYFTINSHASRSNPATNAAHRVSMYDMAPGSGDRGSLYTQIFSLPASGGTPNRQAVEAMGQQFRRTDTNAPVQLACQKNAGMLFTDGYSNTDGPTVGNVDEDLGFPFSDGHDDTLADIATQYYINNLRPTLDTGAVPVPSGCDVANPDPWLDCNPNPHMNFYGITLGATGQFYGVTHFDVMEGYTNPPAWPPRANDQRNTVDDIWHATVNTRGEYINAYTPQDVTDAMRRILAAVASDPTPSGSIALTGARIGTGSLAVEPAYAVERDGTDWFSHLRGFAVTSNALAGTVSRTEVWEASSKIPAYGERNIVYGAGSSAANFSSTNVDLDMLCNNPTTGMSRCNPAASHFGSEPGRLNVTQEQAIRYLRGDTSLELRNGGRLRDRGTRLGDIVNSSPLVSAPTDDYGYKSLSGSDSAGVIAGTYGAYLTSKRSARQIMVYAGANDGMLHAFDGGMGADDDVVDPINGGRERFAFIPQAVLGHMGNLLYPFSEADGGDQKFQHRYFVDGPIAVSDAHYNGSWKTVLVGTTGAGGRGVFALDVSDASRSIGSSFAPSDFLWEVSSLNANLHQTVRENIGHVLGRPVIVPVRSGDAVSWKAIFGNGYNSQSGKAVLFVVDIDRGSPSIRMIEALESGAPAGANGLGNIVVLDRFGGSAQTSAGRDGFADTVYAADQKGAVWKFDLRGDATSITTPLFVTQPLSTDPEYRQPIMGGLTAAAGPAGGVMLYFGTGSYSFVQDTTDDSTQSLYGILDVDTGGTISMGSLIQQTILREYMATIPAPDPDEPDLQVPAREVSSNSMSPGRVGWYLNLPDGERFVGYPRIESGMVFMPTYAPSEVDGCSTSGFNWLFGLNALSGAASLPHVSIGSPGGASPGAGTGALALETGGTAPVRDVEVMSTPRLGTLPGGSDPDDLADALAAQCQMVIQVAGAPPLYLPRACGRQSWRQLL